LDRRKNVNFKEYQELAAKTAIYPEEYRIVYPALGLAGESGEVAEKVKKYIRDGNLDRDLLAKELGDVLWYVSALSRDLGIDLDDVASRNIDKLRSRAERGTLRGSGDSR
jgi:NTP pyrophosphatase (non-canonical NTP hydrolase)